VKYKYIEVFSKTISLEMVVDEDVLRKSIWDTTKSKTENEDLIAAYLASKGAVKISDMSLKEFQKACEGVKKDAAPCTTILKEILTLTPALSKEESLEKVGKILILLAQIVNSVQGQLSEAAENQLIKEISNVEAK